MRAELREVKGHLNRGVQMWGVGLALLHVELSPSKNVDLTACYHHLSKLSYPHVLIQLLVNLLGIFFPLIVVFGNRVCTTEPHQIK